MGPSIGRSRARTTVTGAAAAALAIGMLPLSAAMAGADDSASCTAVTPLAKPTVQVTAPNDTDLVATWDAVPGADGYLTREAWQGVGSDGKPYLFNGEPTPAAGTTRTYTITPPADAGMASIDVVAVNTCTRSDVTRWTGPAHRLAAPRQVDVFPGRTSMQVSWIPGHPRSQPNYTDAPYVATANPGGHTCATGKDQPTNCTITGLTFGKTYTITVQGTNAFGPGGVAAFPVPVRLAVGPTPPRAVRASTTMTTAKVSWRPPRSNGGAPIRHYRVTSTPGGRTCRTSALSCTVTGLAPGTTYRFVVTADNGTAVGFPGGSPVVATMSPPTPTPVPTPEPSPTPKPTASIS